MTRSKLHILCLLCLAASTLQAQDGPKGGSERGQPVSPVATGKSHEEAKAAPGGDRTGLAPSENGLNGAKGEVPEVVDPKLKHEVEFVPGEALGLYRDVIAFFDDQEAEIKARPDSEDKEKALKLIADKRTKVMEAAKAHKKLEKKPEDFGFEKGTKLLVAAYNVCFIGAEVGLLRIKWVTAGLKGRLCLTFGHRMDVTDGKAMKTEAVLSIFMGGQIEKKEKGKLEFSFGGSEFLVSDHSNFKKVKMSDLEGLYQGWAVEIPLPTTTTLSKNGGTWMGSMHKRIGSGSHLAWTGPKGYEYVPYLGSDIYVYEPFGISVGEATTLNAQTELLWFKPLYDIGGAETDEK